MRRASRCGLMLGLGLLGLLSSCGRLDRNEGPVDRQALVFTFGELDSAQRRAIGAAYQAAPEVERATWDGNDFVIFPEDDENMTGLKDRLLGLLPEGLVPLAVRYESRPLSGTATGTKRGTRSGTSPGTSSGK